MKCCLFGCLFAFGRAHVRAYARAVPGADLLGVRSRKQEIRRFRDSGL